jgi:ABC-2 type transport system ATP-binding protein
MKKYSVEVDNICKGYSGRNILDNVSFKVSKGSIHGFLGPNGAGKSTTIKILSGLLSADSGNVIVCGESIFKDKSFKRKIGVLPENPPLFYDMTVRDYLEFVLELYDLDNKDKRINKVLAQVGIAEVSKRLIGNLSKGYKQKVGIAQALVTDPEVLILDEPTVGLDPHAVIEIRELITELKKDHTILLSSHQLHEIGMICDEITIINHGKILKTGNMEGILNSLNRSNYIEIITDEVKDGCYQTLVDSNLITRFTQISENHYRVYPEEDVGSDQISRIVFESGMNIKHFENKAMDLEEVFVHATKEEKVQHAKTIDS